MSREQFCEPEAWDFLVETIHDRLTFYSYRISDDAAQAIADAFMEQYDGVIANGWA